MEKIKTKLRAKEKKDSLKMVGLTWILTALTLPTITVLVPNMFDLFINGEVDFQWIVGDFMMVVPASIVISLIVSLILKKELPRVFTGKLLRYVLLFSTCINTVFIIFYLISDMVRSITNYEV